MGGREVPFEYGWCRQSSLLRVGSAEIIGTAILVFTLAVGLATITNDAIVPITIAATIIAISNALGDLSGAHLNPVITLAVYLTDPRFSLSRAFVYLGCEYCGAFIGFYSAQLAAPLSKNPYNLQTHVQDGYTPFQIGLAEVFFTAFLTLTVLRSGFLLPQPNPLTAVWVACAVLAGSWAGGPVSGCCMNPALVMPFALHLGSWADICIYSFAPCGGAVLACLLSMIIDPEIWSRRVGLHRLSTSSLRISASAMSTAGPGTDKCSLPSCSRQSVPLETSDCRGESQTLVINETPLQAPARRPSGFGSVNHSIARLL